MPGTAVLSDWLFTSAVGVYMLTALLSAIENVLGPRPRRTGVAVAVFGAEPHLGSVLRGIATGRIPWANMYEYLSAVGLVAIGAWLYGQRWRAAVFVLLPVSLLLLLAVNLLYIEVAALRS